MIDNPAAGTLSGALASGFQGYQQGSSLVRDASANLAQANRQQIDINRAAVDLVAGQTQAEAAAVVIKRADGMIGTIIDTFA